MFGLYIAETLCYYIISLDFTTLNEYFCSPAKSPDHVTCGSVLKLYNIDYKIRLHSHDVKYGSGSGQQSVTGTTIPEDINSHWAIKAITGQTCVRGYATLSSFILQLLAEKLTIFIYFSESIKCGDSIRLQHLSTTKNLHSHLFSSPLSGYQEISCYGNNGKLIETSSILGKQCTYINHEHFFR